MTYLANGDQQRVNEKRLFHETSPDSVAICKENFDWRLGGTATGMVKEATLHCKHFTGATTQEKMPISLDLCSWPKYS